jgi:hypothetical protein
VKINVGIIEGQEITLECPHYEDFNCIMGEKSGCPKNEDLCCVHCSEHFACFTHGDIGCMDADMSKESVWDADGETMWENKNPKNHCPVHGHGRRD